MAVTGRLYFVELSFDIRFDALYTKFTNTKRGDSMDAETVRKVIDRYGYGGSTTFDLSLIHI